LADCNRALSEAINRSIGPERPSTAALIRQLARCPKDEGGWFDGVHAHARTRHVGSRAMTQRLWRLMMATQKIDKSEWRPFSTVYRNFSVQRAETASRNG
jgi:hypothetical protein